MDLLTLTGLLIGFGAILAVISERVVTPSGCCGTRLHGSSCLVGQSAAG